MRSVGTRVLHIIRHAESELNVMSAHANAGYFEGVTALDSKLSSNGIEQAKKLRERIENEPIDDPYLLKQVQMIVTSPLSRAILTAQYAMPLEHHGHKYKVKPHIAEQVENTTDIGHHKSDLSQMYPQLSHEFNNLPDAWWYRHPSRRDASVEICPKTDAKLLIEHRGRTPASESKYALRKRSLEFLKWLYSDETLNNNNGINDNNSSGNRDGNTGRIKDSFNIAAFSHACTIRELEMLLKSMNNQMSLSDAIAWGEDDTIRNNTEQITFEMPQNSNEIDWDLLHDRVELAKKIPNHADLDEQQYL